MAVIVWTSIGAVDWQWGWCIATAGIHTSVPAECGCYLSVDSHEYVGSVFCGEEEKRRQSVFVLWDTVRTVCIVRTVCTVHTVHTVQYYNIQYHIVN